MIAHLRGRLVSVTVGEARDAATAVVDVNGVGYRVFVPASLASRLPAVGSDVELHTSMQVREDAMTLYGFPVATARDLFELLLTASGVGAKLALAALSTHPPDALRRAIVDGDLDTLTLVPGVGRKSAQRMVLELKDRLGGDAGDVVITTGGMQPTALTEVRLALIALGYSNVEVHRAVEGLDADRGVDELLRDALRSLGGNHVVRPVP